MQPEAVTATPPRRVSVLRRGQWRVASGAVLVVCAVLSVGAALQLRLAQRDGLASVGRAIAYSTEAAVAFRDAAEAELLVGRIAQREGLDAVRLELGGELLARYDRPPTGDWADRLRRGFAATAEVQVDVDGRAVGRLELSGEAGFLGALLRWTVGGALAGMASIALFVLLTSRRQLALVLAPIQRLSRATHAIRASRDFDRRVDAAAVTELDSLAADVNALLAEVQRYERELVDRHGRLEAAYEELAHYSRHDALTGLANRRYFETRLQEALSRARREGERLGLLFIDVNRFKQVNDQHGHAAGDAVLKAMAAPGRRAAPARPGGAPGRRRVRRARGPAARARGAGHAGEPPGRGGRPADRHRWRPQPRGQRQHRHGRVPRRRRRRRRADAPGRCGDVRRQGRPRRGRGPAAGMSPPGRPRGEYRRAQHGGSPMSPPGRSQGENRSAQHEGSPVSPPGGSSHEPAGPLPSAHPGARSAEGRLVSPTRLARGFQPGDEGWQLDLAVSLLFEFDSDRLKPEQAERVRRLGRSLREIDVPALHVLGHTDNVGAPEYNRSLSLRRARAVAAVLAEAGWPPARLKAAGLGMARPIADNRSEEGRARNRRARSADGPDGRPPRRMAAGRPTGT
ncbi:diguanylate cyclase domain-containing protein [Piscinibacter sakaiensis]